MWFLWLISTAPSVVVSERSESVSVGRVGGGDGSWWCQPLHTHPHTQVCICIVLWLLFFLSVRWSIISFLLCFAVCFYFCPGFVRIFDLVLVVVLVCWRMSLFVFVVAVPLFSRLHLPPSCFPPRSLPVLFPMLLYTLSTPTPHPVTLLHLITIYDKIKHRLCDRQCILHSPIAEQICLTQRDSDLTTKQTGACFVF